MESEQDIFVDVVRPKPQEFEHKLHPHAADTRNARKHLKNPIARQYGDMVRRQPSKLATDSARRRLR